MATENNPPSSPDEYLNIPVPLNIQANWRSWDAVEWRLSQHYNRGSFCPPDQRFGVDTPGGLCRIHRRTWHAWRNRRFNGIAFPGALGGDGFSTLRGNATDDWERCRAEWDEKTIEQMRAIEACCKGIKC